MFWTFSVFRHDLHAFKWNKVRHACSAIVWHSLWSKCRLQSKSFTVLAEFCTVQLLLFVLVRTWDFDINTLVFLWSNKLGILPKKSISKYAARLVGLYFSIFVFVLAGNAELWSKQKVVCQKCPCTSILPWCHLGNSSSETLNQANYQAILTTMMSKQ